MRRWAKTLLCGGLVATGLDRLIGLGLRRAGRPWIVGFHRVVDDVRAEAVMPGLFVSRRTFEAEVDWLARHFEVTTLEHTAAAIAAGERSARPPAAITFDDGYRDNYEVAFPILMRKGLPAAFFLITDLVDQARSPLHDRVYHGLHGLLAAAGEPQSATCAYVVTRVLLHAATPAALDRLCDDLEGAAPAGPMTWEMARQMRQAGMEIGSHGATHRLLSRASPATARQELERSKAALERELEEPTRLFSYPDGDFDPDVVAAVSAAGYDFAVTTCHYRDAAHPQLTLPRTMLCEGAAVGPFGTFSGAIMRCHANGVPRLWRAGTDDHGALAQTVAKWL